MQMTLKDQNLNTLWMWWFYTTAPYVLISSFFNETVEAPTSLIGYIFGTLGLFVPFGALSIMTFMGVLGWASLIFFLFAVTKIEKYFTTKNYSTAKRIVLNLLVLLILTMIVDVIRGTPFVSWMMFFNGGVFNESMIENTMYNFTL